MPKKRMKCYKIFSLKDCGKILFPLKKSRNETRRALEARGDPLSGMSSLLPDERGALVSLPGGVRSCVMLAGGRVRPAGVRIRGCTVHCAADLRSRRANFANT